MSCFVGGLVFPFIRGSIDEGFLQLTGFLGWFTECVRVLCGLPVTVGVCCSLVLAKKVAGGLVDFVRYVLLCRGRVWGEGVGGGVRRSVDADRTVGFGVGAFGGVLGVLGDLVWGLVVVWSGRVCLRVPWQSI